VREPEAVGGASVRHGDYTIIVHRNGALASRQFTVPRWLARTIVTTAVVVLVVAVALAAAYGPIVTAAARTPLLERRVSELTRQNARVERLAAALNLAEARYEQLRGMLGARVPPVPAPTTQFARGEEPLYVAPPILARPPAAFPAASETGGRGSIPHRWPLSVPSYRTRGMVAGTANEEPHPGIDLAVPEGSHVEASGGGVVEAAGTDPAYGLFVLLRHPEGYESMYGHLSRLLVWRGDSVTAGQVIALSGNTGRSTAPHLHFEIRLNGRSIDPLSLVKEGT
jgi:murein DD-endopeptidase MepM/ murein hydrolase activator NlpD